MNILLDTHILLWALTGDEKLPDSVVSMLEDISGNTVFYSIASVWETEIKNSLGKLPISGRELSEYCRQAGFMLLPIREEHIFTISTLAREPEQPRHNDPFDRIMLAQAKKEQYKFITHDALIAGYREECIEYV